MSNDEIKHDPKYGHGNYDPCGKCMTIIGEIFEPMDETEVDQAIAIEMFYEDILDGTGQDEPEVDEIT